jgi:protein pelota
MLVLMRDETRVKLKPEVAEDLWHLEKIIRPDDFVSGSTTRKFVSDGGGQERKPMFLKLRVEKAEFHKGFEKLRILGVIVEGRPMEFISLGAHHSLDIGISDIVTVEKEQWKQYELDRIKEAQKAAKRPRFLVLIMDESDAELFVVREYGIDSLGAIHTSGAGKYAEEAKERKNKYYSDVLGMIKDKELRLIVAGPGFERENFLKFLKEKDSKFAQNVAVEAVGNTGRQGVYELVNKDAFEHIVRESRFAEETRTIEKLVAEISASRSKAAYGLDNVRKALEYGAVDTLLVIDKKLFEDRDTIEPLLDAAEKKRSNIMLVSHENEISKKLEALGGIAALLRFAVE